MAAEPKLSVVNRGCRGVDADIPASCVARLGCGPQLGKRYVTLIELLVADTDGKTVYPDVITHRRGTLENYLVLEFKKTSSQVRDEVDFEKLQAYKQDPRLQYEHAIFIELQINAEPGVARAVWVD